MRFGPESIEWLAEEMEPEGEMSLITAPDQSLEPAGALVPSEWRRVLGQDNPGEAVADLLWKGLEGSLPKTVSILRRKLCSTAILLTQRRPPSLLYLFTEDEEPYVYRGFVPAGALPQAVAAIPVDLSAFYRLHDGWYSLDSQDGGLWPVARWENYAGAGGTNPFVAVLGNGSMRLGFGRVGGRWAAYSLWPNDEEVEEIADFWAAVDESYEALLEDLDDVG